jgi:hypothetical protein
VPFAPLGGQPNCGIQVYENDVAQAFQPAGLATFQSPVFTPAKHGTGKFREPADKNVVATSIMESLQ